MSKFRFVFSDHARQAAEQSSSLAEVEALARRELVAVFSDSLDLDRYFSSRAEDRGTSIAHWFAHADEEYHTYPHDPETWMIDTLYGEPPCPRYTITFTERAKGLIQGLGWRMDFMEHEAWCALKAAHPEDYGFCDFKVPLQEFAFVGTLKENDTVEIDIYEWWHTRK